jgi:hypothetical protein
LLKCNSKKWTLPTEKLVAGEHNSEHGAAVNNILTYVTGFLSFEPADQFADFSHSDIHRVNSATEYKSFNLTTAGT